MTTNQVSESEKEVLMEAVGRFGSNGIDCLIKGADLGARTFEHITTISSAAIAAIIAFLSLAEKQASEFPVGSIGQVFILISLILFFVTIFLSITRNYYGGNDLVFLGKKFLQKSDINKHKTNDKSDNFNGYIKFGEIVNEYKRCCSQRHTYSILTKIFFGLAIICIIIAFSTAFFN